MVRGVLELAVRLNLHSYTKWMYRYYLLLYYAELCMNTSTHNQIDSIMEGKRGSRGGGTGGLDPPWDLSEVGSCVGRGGGSMVIFTSLLSFFLARFARQYYTNILHVYILPWSMFSTERSSFLYISLIQITSHPLLLWKSIFIFFLPRITPFYTIIAKKFWGGPPDPPSPTHLQYQIYHAICVFCKERLAVVQEKRGLQLYKKTMPPYRK